MTDTPNLGLPYIDASQAQKHVTHNEALGDLDALVHLSVKRRDLAAPPASPANGDRYLTPAGATGSFAGHDDSIATYRDGAWVFSIPRNGWRCFVESENVLLLRAGGAWSDVGAAIRALQNLTSVAIGAGPDPANPLLAKLNAMLFTARAASEGGSGDMRMTLNKSATGNTVSQLYQDNFSGRAETGLCGDDHFHIKVSADGASWREALNVDPATGLVAFPSGVAGGINAAATENYAFGTQAAASLAGATGNIFGGYQTAWHATSGSYNVALGYQAARDGAITGSYNAAIGYQALKSLTSGSNDVAIGQGAGASLTTASNVVMVGNSAGAALMNWDDNIFIGRQAGAALTSPGSTESAPSVAIGLFALKYASADGGSVAIGAYSVGGNGGSTSPIGYRNVGVGRCALGLVTQGVQNTAIGDSALAQVSIGGGNAGVGRSAGGALQTGGWNTFIGHSAGSYFTAGDNNICIGNAAGSGAVTTASQTGGANIWIGTCSGPASASLTALTGCIGIGSDSSGGASGAQLSQNYTTKIGKGQTDATIAGRLYSTRKLATLSNAAGQTLTTAQMLECVLTRSGGAAVNDTMPTAAAIVAAMPGCEVGSSFEWHVINNNTGTLTIIAGSGVTLTGTMTVAAGNIRKYFGVVTAVVSGSEAVTLQGAGTSPV